MKIYAPNVHLFAFELYKGSNIDLNTLQSDQNFLWERGDEIIRVTLHQDLQLSQRLDTKKEPHSPRVDLIKDTEVIDDNYAVSFDGKITHNQDLLIKGFAHPLRIYDSYSLWLNLRRPEKENNQVTDDLDIDVLQKFNPNNCLTLKENPLFLGQTLLITAWLTGAKEQKFVKQIADECLKHIFANQNTVPPFFRQGELFGSAIFEYGLFSQLDNYQHVLIWLFADNKADEKFNLCYQELLDLFFFRTKVIKAYKDSRAIYQQLDLIYRQIEEKIEQIPEAGDNKKITGAYLTQLQKQLETFPQLALRYTRLLRNLEDYQNTIAINGDNYADRVQQIQGILPGEDLGFLETFSQRNCSFFQQQIKADLGYFQHGSELLDKAINSIRGIVEIEQDQSDKSLERTVQILGIGFGGGSIASGVITANIDKIKIPLANISPNHPLHPFYASLLLSIIATLVFIALGWMITKRK